MTKEVMKLAIEALNTPRPSDSYPPLWCTYENTINTAIKALKEALKQEQVEPVGKFAKFTDGIWREVTDGSAGVPLYTTPQTKEWVGLTNEEISKVLYDSGDPDGLPEYARAIEAKLKEKNETQTRRID